MDVLEENKILAKDLVRVFGGGQASVAAYWDEGETQSVAILTCRNSPQKHVNSYATVTLSNFPLFENGKELAVRAEIVGACEAEAKDFANVLSTCALNVIKEKWALKPGVIFRDVIAMYSMSKTMAHVIFVTPFLWGEALRPLKKVAFLQAVPISESESRYCDQHGPDALERLFEHKQIDVYDIDRKPSV